MGGGRLIGREAYYKDITSRGRLEREGGLNKAFAYLTFTKRKQNSM